MLCTAISRVPGLQATQDLSVREIIWLSRLCSDAPVRPGAPQIIVEKMVEYLRGVTDDVAKADVVRRIGDLAERYAPDTQWFIDTMNQARPGSSRIVKMLSRYSELFFRLLSAGDLMTGSSGGQRLYVRQSLGLRSNSPLGECKQHQRNIGRTLGNARPFLTLLISRERVGSGAAAQLAGRLRCTPGICCSVPSIGESPNKVPPAPTPDLVKIASGPFCRCSSWAATWCP